MACFEMASQSCDFIDKALVASGHIKSIYMTNLNMRLGTHRHSLHEQYFFDFPFTSLMTAA